MPIPTPASTLTTMAHECVQRILRDITDPAFPPGMSAEVEATRYQAIITWAKTGQQIANGELSDARLTELIQECVQRFDTCEDVVAV